MLRNTTWSVLRVSNSRPLPWQGSVPPTELRTHWSKLRALPPPPTGWKPVALLNELNLLEPVLGHDPNSRTYQVRVSPPTLHRLEPSPGFEPGSALYESAVSPPTL